MVQGILKQVLHLHIYRANISLDWGALSETSRQLLAKETQRKWFFTQSSIKQWHSVLQNVMDAKTLHGFKAQLFQFTGKIPLRTIKPKDTLYLSRYPWFGDWEDIPEKSNYTLVLVLYICLYSNK